MGATIRENQAALTDADWKTWVAAIDALHGTAAAAAPQPGVRPGPRVGDEHGRDGVGSAHHAPDGHGRRNFLAWHRRFLRRFELRLQQIDPDLSVPHWGLGRRPADPSSPRRPGDVDLGVRADKINAATSFARFQRRYTHRDLTPTGIDITGGHPALNGARLSMSSHRPTRRGRSGQRTPARPTACARSAQSWMCTTLPPRVVITCRRPDLGEAHP